MNSAVAREESSFAFYFTFGRKKKRKESTLMDASGDFEPGFHRVRWV
jgi:hypothetical protein